MAALRVLAFAAATGRIGSVLFVGHQLMDWHISNKAAKNSVEAAGHAQTLINLLTPDVVITEDPGTAHHKGERTLALVTAIARTAALNHLLDVTVPREQHYANKYDEADELAQRYPEIAAWKPAKRRFFENEPRNTVLFEALALAEDALEDHAP